MSRVGNPYWLGRDRIGGVCIDDLANAGLHLRVQKCLYIPS